MMKMGLYKLFSCNLEVQYKSYFLSKAMLFTILTTVLTIILPFVLAYRSRGKLNNELLKMCDPFIRNLRLPSTCNDFQVFG